MLDFSLRRDNFSAVMVSEISLISRLLQSDNNSAIQLEKIGRAAFTSITGCKRLKRCIKEQFISFMRRVYAPYSSGHCGGNFH